MLSVVAKHDGVSESRFTEAGKKALDLCYTKGWVHKTIFDDEMEGYRFASILHQWYVSTGICWTLLTTSLQRYCTALLLPKEPTLGSINTPFQLVTKIVEGFRPSKLSFPPRGPEYPNSTPPESAYSQEFYRASDCVAEATILWSPEYGDAGRKSGGSIDFFLAPEGWDLNC